MVGSLLEAINRAGDDTNPCCVAATVVATTATESGMNLWYIFAGAAAGFVLFLIANYHPEGGKS